MGHPPQLSNEGPRTNEMCLIGIELAITPEQGREVELEMHGMRHTVQYDSWSHKQVRVTIHTSNGDITSRFPLRPGNYVQY